MILKVSLSLGYWLSKGRTNTLHPTNLVASCNARM